MNTKQMDLARLRAWIATYPGYDMLKQFQCDYADHVPASGAISPAGLVETGRTQDILGNVTVKSRYHFKLYYVFAKAPGDDENASENAQWVLDFQQWVQRQSICGSAPRFGNTGAPETIKAQNGALHATDDEGAATYTVALSAEFTEFYEVN